jgi:hypothetical protein
LLLFEGRQVQQLQQLKLAPVLGNVKRRAGDELGGRGNLELRFHQLMAKVVEFVREEHCKLLAVNQRI